MSLVTTAEPQLVGRARAHSSAISERLAGADGSGDAEPQARGWSGCQARNSLLVVTAWACGPAPRAAASRSAGMSAGRVEVGDRGRRAPATSRARLERPSAVAAAGSSGQQLERRRRDGLHVVVARPARGQARPRQPGRGGDRAEHQRPAAAPSTSSVAARRRPEPAGQPQQPAAQRPARLPRIAALGGAGRPGASTRRRGGRPAQGEVPAPPRRSPPRRASRSRSRRRELRRRRRRVEPGRERRLEARRTGCGRPTGSRASASTSSRSGYGRPSTSEQRVELGERQLARRARASTSSPSIGDLERLGVDVDRGQRVVVDHVGLGDVAGRLDGHEPAAQAEPFGRARRRGRPATRTSPSGRRRRRRSTRVGRISTGCGVGIEAFGSPSAAHTMAPPLITSSGRTPKKRGSHSTRSASLPGSTEPTSCVDAVGDGRVDRVLGDVAPGPLVVGRRPPPERPAPRPS